MNMFPVANLSCEAGAGGGKPERRLDCFCKHPPVGGDQIAGPQPEQPASGRPRGAGGRILAETRELRRLNPAGRWAEDGREPSNTFAGCDWPEQNLPERNKKYTLD